MNSAEERMVMDYLGSYRGEFVSAREVCRRAGGKQKWEEDERWAMPVLLSLVSMNLVESDNAGRYRLPEKSQETI
jgi:hypothetical protein